MNHQPPRTPQSLPQIRPFASLNLKPFTGAALKLILVLTLLALLLTACGGGTKPKPGAATWDSAKWDSATWQP